MGRKYAIRSQEPSLAHVCNGDERDIRLQRMHFYPFHNTVTHLPYHKCFMYLVRLTVANDHLIHPRFKRGRLGSNHMVEADYFIFPALRGDPEKGVTEFFIHGMNTYQALEDRAPFTAKLAGQVKSGFDTITNRYGTKFVKKDGDTIEWRPSLSNFFYKWSK